MPVPRCAIFFLVLRQFHCDFSLTARRNLYPNDTIDIGLPFKLTAANYVNVFEASGDGDIYQSQFNGNCLTVVVFTHSDTRMSPLI